MVMGNGYGDYSSASVNELLESRIGGGCIPALLVATKDRIRAADADGRHDVIQHGAQTELEVHTGTMAISLQQRSLKDLVAMQAWYAGVQRWQKLTPLRPPPSDTHGHGSGRSILGGSGRSTGGAGAGAGARDWWQFAIQSTIEYLPSHIFNTKLRPYIDGALEYDALFKRKYANAEYAAGRAEGRPWHQPLRDHEVVRLEELEEFLPLDMVRYRREAMWIELVDDEAHDEIRKRDAIELEKTLLATAAAGWKPAMDGSLAADWSRPGADVILTSHWGHYEGAKGKLKRSWLVLADIGSVQPTRYSGWLEMTTSTVLPAEVECTFTEAGSLGLAFADPEGIATIKQIKPNTQAVQHSQVLSDGMRLIAVGGTSCVGLSYTDSIGLVRDHPQRPITLKFKQPQKPAAAPPAPAAAAAAGQKLWFRLKGGALSYYNDDTNGQQPIGMIGLTAIKSVKQVPGSADTFEIETTNSKLLSMCCDVALAGAKANHKYKEMKQWLSAFDAVLQKVAATEEQAADQDRDRERCQNTKQSRQSTIALSFFEKDCL